MGFIRSLEMKLNEILKSVSSIDEYYQNKKFNLKEGIQHIEDAEMKEFLHTVENLANMTVTEKLDGCFSGETLLETLDGIVTIQEIVELQKDTYIKAFDHESNEVVYTKILNYSKEENKDKQWYLVEFENGESFKLTGNHKIWLPELKCYRRVDELDGTEKIMYEKLVDSL
jgi:hypothetical protein